MFDAETLKISMPPGDTGNLWVEIDWAVIRPGDAVVFAIVDKRSGTDLMVKAAEIADGNRALIRLCNHDTRELEAGNYNWQLRIVTGPGKDAEGNVEADDCEDHVVSVFSGDNMPVFRLERRGAHV